MPAPHKLFALAAAAVLVSCASDSDVASLGRPPVVLIVFDALHAGHVTHLGYERDTTPNIDALAADGVTFKRAFAPAPFTVSGIASLLTGRLPDSHGVTGKAAALRPQEQTLGEVMKAAGYRTIAGVSQPNGGSMFGNDQGFDRFDELYIPSSEEEADYFVARTGESFHIPTADEFAELARATLAEVSEDPLFLYLHVLEPHAPYFPPQTFRSRWLDEGYDGHFASGETKRFLDTFRGVYDPNGEDIQAAIDLYDATLAFADHNLGEIVAHLREAGVYDEALVIVTSDHGEAFWQHGRWGHNEQLYDEMLQVPLIIKPPKSMGIAGVELEALASTTDILPTICHWLDLAPGGEPLDGVSLAPIVLDPTLQEGSRELLLRSHHANPHVGLRTASTKTIVLRDEQTGERQGVERYRLDSDPGELRNVAAAERAEVMEVADRLVEWILDRAVARREGGQELSQREEELLKRLGYTD